MSGFNRGDTATMQFRDFSFGQGVISSAETQRERKTHFVGTELFGSKRVAPFDISIVFNSPRALRSLSTW